LHEHLELLNKKTAFLERILELTKNTKLTGNLDDMEREIADFSHLYERRSIIMNGIHDADEKIAALDIQEKPGAEYLITLAAINSKQKKIAAELIELDKANMLVYKKLSEHIKGDLKNVRQTMDVNEAYMDDFESLQGYYFDKKN